MAKLFAAGFSSLSNPAEQTLASQNLSALERQVLAAIVSREAITTTELTPLLGNRQEVISNTLNKLYRKGLLFRIKDKAKKRGFIYGTEEFQQPE